MKRGRRTLAVLLAIAMVFCYMPGLAFADTEETTAAESKFADMPQDWSTAALENAVANGLIKGYEGEAGLLIKPNGTLTRAELATIVNRAFGAAETATLTGVTDVVATDWFAGEMQKAVKMGTLKLDTVIRPNDSITRQEAFTVLARAFKLTDKDGATLSQFKDGSSVAAWAKESICALADAGYVTGADGNVNPKANITRAEFAKIMDNIVKQYVTASGTVTQVVASGNVMINAPGVTLKDVTVNGNVIIGDGVGSGDVKLDNVNVKGDVIARGGGVNSIVISGGSVTGQVVVAKVDGKIRVSVEGGANVSVVLVEDGKDNVIIEGKMGTLVVDGPVPVTVQNATIATVEVAGEGASLNVAKGSTVTSLVVQKSAEDAKVAVAGTVTTLKAESAGAAITVSGTVKTIEVAAAATDTKLEIAKGATVETLKNDSKDTTLAGDPPKKIEGNTPGEAKPETPPATGGGGGGGGGGSSSVTVGTLTFDESTLKIGGNAVPKSGGYYEISKVWTTTTDLEVTASGTGFVAGQTYPMFVTIYANNNEKAKFTQNVTGAQLNKTRYIREDNVTDDLDTALNTVLVSAVLLWNKAEVGDVVTVKIGTTVNGSATVLTTLNMKVVN